MLILAVDTSNSTCCAGLYENGKELSYEISFEKRTHSETFMPLVERVVKASGKTYQDIDAIASTVGPGSFTGIRIGLSAVKGMALALNIPCISCSSTKALAMSVTNVSTCPKETVLIPSFDARNKRVFAAAFANDSYETVVEEGAYAAVDFVEMLSKIENITSKAIIVLGDGAPVIEEAIKANEAFNNMNIQYAPGATITPSGISKSADGEELISGAKITASYCAVSSAERLRKE